jgi:hypothetical protein
MLGHAGEPAPSCTLSAIAQSHIGYIRLEFNWAEIEPAPGTFDFSHYDPLVQQAAVHHLRVLALLLDAPSWASSRPAQGGVAGLYPPRDAATFSAFAAACVARYGHHGSFWRAHPGLRYLPVLGWEVWNEPNLEQFWAPVPSTSGYAGLLRAVYSAVKQVDRSSTVIAAGGAFTSSGAVTRWIDALYRAGARGHFDAFGIHPYAPSVNSAYGRITAVRAALDHHRDRRRSVWVTEFGWAGGPPNPFIVDPKGQRAGVSALLRLVLRHRGSLRLSGFVYFDWKDPVQQGSDHAWAYHLGLLDSQLRPKPLYAPFVRIARAFNR